MPKLLSWLAAGLLLTATAVAEDVWIVQFQAFGGIVDPPCAGVIWFDDVVFHNATSGDLTVHWLDTSGSGAFNPVPLAVPAQKTRSGFGSLVAEIVSWSPTTPDQLWVVHLDVPAGISVASRANAVIGTDPSNCGPDPGPTAAFAGPFLPVVRALTLPGIPQTILSTDIGESAKFGGSRSKVAIYNGGSVAATATVDLHRGCDDTSYAFRAISIPPQSIVQAGGFAAVEDGLASCTAFNTAESLGYAVVTVDQPSFAYMVTLANGLPPRAPYSISFSR